MTDYQLTLEEPAVLTVTTKDGSKTCKFDIFETWRKIVEADKTATEDKRWMTLTQLLAQSLGVQIDEIGENQVRLFRQAILDLGNIEQEKLKNVLGKIVSSQQPSLESQETT